MITIAAITGSILFSLTVILYILLAAGAPLGEYAMGGANKVLPPKVRTMVVFAILIQIFGIIILLQAGGIIDSAIPPQVVKTGCYVYAIYLSVNVVMNLFSKSNKERLLMTPLSAITATCFWVAALSI